MDKSRNRQQWKKMSKRHIETGRGELTVSLHKDLG